MMSVGFIGLGLMGSPMASNIIRAGVPVTVWNRTKAKCAGAERLGATVSSSPRQVAAASDVLITMVSDDHALDEIMFGSGEAAESMAPGTVVLDMSTTSPAYMIDLSKRLGARGIALVDSPVFGSTEPAESGDLWAVVGAEASDLEKVRPLLEMMCQTVFEMGPIGAGSYMKVSGNLVVTGMIALLGEALSVGTSGDLDPQKMLQVLTAIDFTSPLWHGKGDLVVDADFSPRFPLRHALKDVRLALGVGESHDLKLSVIGGAHQEYSAAADAGLADEDVMAVIKAVRR